MPPPGAVPAKPRVDPAARLAELPFGGAQEGRENAEPPRATVVYTMRGDAEEEVEEATSATVAPQNMQGAPDG